MYSNGSKAWEWITMIEHIISGAGGRGISMKGIAKQTGLKVTPYLRRLVADTVDLYNLDTMREPLGPTTVRDVYFPEGTLKRLFDEVPEEGTLPDPFDGDLPF